MMIYSDEMLNAMKIGYHACAVEILRGYFFERKENIFKEYVTELYNIRLEYDKSHPMNFIAKILLNSLYGRFGMDDNFGSTTIMNANDFTDFMENTHIDKLRLITDIDNIADHKIISINKDQNISMLDNLNENHNVNVGIASSITALARVEMSKYKNNPDIKLYYTDTDSIFIDLDPLELEQIYPDILGNKLGQLKLEYEIKRAVSSFPTSKSKYSCT